MTVPLKMYGTSTFEIEISAKYIVYAQWIAASALLK